MFVSSPLGGIATDPSQRIPVIILPGGAAYLQVDVQGASHALQFMLIDTGSPHTYLINLSGIDARFPVAAASVHGGYRQSQINPDSYARSIDASGVNFVDTSGMRFLGWVRRRFTLGSHGWVQKFAIAEIPSGGFDTWNSHRITGLIGASPHCRFTQQHPVFSFTTAGQAATDPNQDSDRFMIISELQNEICRDSIITRIPVRVHDRWSIVGSVRFGETFQLAPSRHLVVDTGAGMIGYPKYFHRTFINHLLSLSIPSLRIETFSWGDVVWVNEENVIPFMPPIRIFLEDDAGNSVIVTIPQRSLFTCTSGICRLNVESLADNSDLFLLGLPFFRAINVEFNSSENIIGICEPIPTILTSPPLIQVIQTPPTPPSPPPRSPTPPRPPTPKKKPTSRKPIRKPAAPPSPQIPQDPNPPQPSMRPPPVDLQSLYQPPYRAPRLPDNVRDTDQDEEESESESYDENERSTPDMRLQRKSYPNVYAELPIFLLVTCLILMIN